MTLGARMAGFARGVAGPGGLLSRRLVLGGSAALVAGAASSRALAAVGGDAPAVEAGRAIVREIMSQTHAPAMSAAVCRDGRLVWAEAFGLADMESRLPATPAGRFRLASVSKVIAAAVAARLAERDVVNLDAPIVRYRPSLPVQHRLTTLRQLLAHTGGVRHYIGRDYDPRQPGGAIDQRVYRHTGDALAIFIDDPLVSVPGEAFNYSTFGYTLMSAVLESATGKAFPDLVAEEVTGPLGLPSLIPDITARAVPDRVSCYQVAHETGRVFKAPPINSAYKWAGGGYLGAASDVALFCTALVKPGYLTQDALRQTFTPWPPTRTPAPVQVGFGWRIDRDAAGRVRHHHAGSIAGGRSIVMFLPEAGVSVALLSNLSDLPVDPLTPAQRVAEAFLASPNGASGANIARTGL